MSAYAYDQGRDGSVKVSVQEMQRRREKGEKQMIMTDEEILKEYRGAKDQKKQIGILADQNCVPRADMAQWLADHGEIIDKRSTRYAAKKPEIVYSVEVTEEATGSCQLTAEEARTLKYVIEASVDGLAFESMADIKLLVQAYDKLAEVCG